MLNFSNFLEFSWILKLIRSFSKYFSNHSGPQPSTKHRKILCEFLRRLDQMRSLSGVVEKSYHEITGQL